MFWTIEKDFDIITSHSLAQCKDKLDSMGANTNFKEHEQVIEFTITHDAGRFSKVGILRWEAIAGEVSLLG